MNRLPLIALFFVLAACARTANSTSDPYESGGGEIAYVPNNDPPPTEPVPASPWAGNSFDSPYPTCGALESYQVVADYQCADGSVPLGGDLAAGQYARLGSSGAHQESTSIDEAHIVDIYRVDCPDGPKELFVCLYHCEAGRSPYD